MPSLHPIRIAQIGCGTWGRNLLRNLVSLQSAKLVAVVDPSPAAQAFARSMAPDAEFCQSFEQLNTGLVDAAVIASPGPLHTLHTLQCLSAGLHVFVEKPMAIRVSDANAMINALALSRRIGFVGHLMLHHPAVEQLIRMISSGEHGAFLRFRSERRSIAASTDPDGSPLWSLAPHDLSVLLAIAPRPMHLSSALREGNGRAAENYTLRFDSGKSEYADIIVSRGGNLKIRKMVVDCEKTSFDFDDTRAQSKLITIDRRSGREESIQYDVTTEPLRAELESFVDCIRSGTPSKTTSFQHGLQVVSILETADRYACARISRPPVVEAL